MSAQPNDNVMTAALTRRFGKTVQYRKTISYLLLYTVTQAGGFMLPFVVVGSAIFLVGFSSMLVLPPQNGKFVKRTTITTVLLPCL